MMNDTFRRFSKWTSDLMGTPWAFGIAFAVVLIWAVTGPLFGFSDTWQLVINTGTTIVTFLMVFLIQNTQNRDAKAIHLKLDELIHSVKGARDSMLNLEDLSDEELQKLHVQFERMRRRQNGGTAKGLERVDEELEERGWGALKHKGENHRGRFVRHVTRVFDNFAHALRSPGKGS